MRFFSKPHFKIIYSYIFTFLQPHYVDDYLQNNIKYVWFQCLCVFVFFFAGINRKKFIKKSLQVLFAMHDVCKKNTFIPYHISFEWCVNQNHLFLYIWYIYVPLYRWMYVHYDNNSKIKNFFILHKNKNRTNERFNLCFAFISFFRCVVKLQIYISVVFTFFLTFQIHFS